MEKVQRERPFSVFRQNEKKRTQTPSIFRFFFIFDDRRKMDVYAVFYAKRTLKGKCFKSRTK